MFRAFRTAKIFELLVILVVLLLLDCDFNIFDVPWDWFGWVEGLSCFDVDPLARRCEENYVV
jgi:hypothetical protein